MVNDDLGSPTASRPSWLEKFQAHVLFTFSDGGHGSLVDVGCGAGRFLIAVAGRFKRACGVEISLQSVEFARRQGLEIVGGLDDVDGPIDVATAWHSLEHFPAAALEKLVEMLSTRLARGGCVIVSVPNAASWQCRWLGRRYAFYDPPGHLQQFTPDSLNRLFTRHGFVRTGAAISWPYNVFGWIQGLLNLVMPGHNYIYYRLKRGISRVSAARDVVGLLLVPIVAGPALLLSMCEALNPDEQSVLTWRFAMRP